MRGRLAVNGSECAFWQPYSEAGGIPLVSEWSPLLTLLEETVVRVQSLLLSPYVAHVAERCKLWEAKLRRATDFVERWQMCQLDWVVRTTGGAEQIERCIEGERAAQAMEPVLSGDEIIRLLPSAGRSFLGMDATWRRTMAQVSEAKTVRTRAR